MVSYSREVWAVGATFFGFWGFCGFAATSLSAMVPPGFAAGHSLQRGTLVVGSAVELVHADPRIVFYQQTASRFRGQLDRGGEGGELRLPVSAEHPRGD